MKFLKKILRPFTVKFYSFDYFKYNALVVNFIIGLLVIILQIYIKHSYDNYMPVFLTIIYFVIFIIFFFFDLYCINQTIKLEQTREMLETEKLYNKTLNTLQDSIRGFKHDFNNIVQAIGGYISSNNIDGLRSYYNDLLDECQINNNLSTLDPELINNPVIYNLIANKYYKAEQLNIKLNLEMTTDLNTLNIKMYEFSRIFAILLDNAIEAASKCDKKIINLVFMKNPKRNSNLIIIQNTYTNKDVSINKIFEKGYSSKAIEVNDKNHGLGLWEVRKYLQKNNNLDLFTSKSKELFSQQLEIFN